MIAVGLRILVYVIISHSTPPFALVKDLKEKQIPSSTDRDSPARQRTHPERTDLLVLSDEYIYKCGLVLMIEFSIQMHNTMSSKNLPKIAAIF